MSSLTGVDGLTLRSLDGLQSIYADEIYLDGSNISIDLALVSQLSNDFYPLSNQFVNLSNDYRALSNDYRSLSNNLPTFYVRRDGSTMTGNLTFDNGVGADIPHIQFNRGGSGFARVYSSNIGPADRDEFIGFRAGELSAPNQDTLRVFGGNGSSTFGRVSILRSNSGPLCELDVNGTLFANAYSNLPIIDSWSNASTSNIPTNFALSNVWIRLVGVSNVVVGLSNSFTGVSNALSNYVQKAGDVMTGDLDILSNARLGIGTATPATFLHVRGSNNAILRIDSGNATNSAGSVEFFGSSGPNFHTASLVGETRATDATCRLDVKVGSGRTLSSSFFRDGFAIKTSNLVETLTLEGSLGVSSSALIGKNQSRGTLNIAGVDDIIQFYNSNGTAGARWGYLYHGGSNGELEMRNTQNNNISFSTNDTRRMYVNSNGSVSIATTAVPATLTVAGSFSNSGTMMVGQSIQTSNVAIGMAPNGLYTLAVNGSNSIFESSDVVNVILRNSAVPFGASRGGQLSFIDGASLVSSIRADHNYLSGSIIMATGGGLGSIRDVFTLNARGTIISDLDNSGANAFFRGGTSPQLTVSPYSVGGATGIRFNYSSNVSTTTSNWTLATGQGGGDTRNLGFSVSGSNVMTLWSNGSIAVGSNSTVVPRGRIDIRNNPAGPSSQVGVYSDLGSFFSDGNGGHNFIARQAPFLSTAQFCLFSNNLTPVFEVKDSYQDIFNSALVINTRGNRPIVISPNKSNTELSPYDLYEGLAVGLTGNPIYASVSNALTSVPSLEVSRISTSYGSALSINHASNSSGAFEKTRWDTQLNGIKQTTTNNLELNQNRLYVSGDTVIGSTSITPSNVLHVNGAITQSGYAFYGLSTSNYSNGSTALQFGNTNFSSGWTNNTSNFVPTYAGVYSACVFLNSDSTYTGRIDLTLQYSTDAITWTTYTSVQLYEEYYDSTSATTTYLFDTPAGRYWRVLYGNPTGSTKSFAIGSASDWWSRIMIFKVG